MRAFLAWRVLALMLFVPAAARGANYGDVLPGAKAQAMGMAFVSVADDPYALFYNPAGLAGSEFIQSSLSVGRMLSPVGPLTHWAMTYTRPYPLLPRATVGAAYFGERQTNGGDQDRFLFSFAAAHQLPYLQRPLKYGGNFKFLSMDEPGNSKFGVGLDAGALVESDRGVRLGVALTDLSTKMPVPTPTLSLGVSYVWRGWLMPTVDVRSRKGLTEVYPGVEAGFHQGLVKVRMGKGLRLDGVGQIAFGVGMNLSPWFVDTAATLPWGSLNRQAGSFQVSVAYRFGAPSFFGRFVGDTSRLSEELRSDVAGLEERRKTLQAQVAVGEANRTASEGQVRSLELRTRELQEQIRLLEIRLEERGFDTQKPKPPPFKPKPVVTWPKKHTVVQGDTLRSIAAEHYGDPGLWEILYNANADKVERGLPKVGAVLTVPAPKK